MAYETHFSHAKKRVGETPEDRARWLLSQREGGPGDNLTWELAVFLDPKADETRLQLPSAVDARDLQQLVSRGLRTLLSERRRKTWQLRITETYELSLSSHNTIGVKPSSSLEDKLKRRIHETVVQVKDRIRLCCRRGCVKLFVQEDGRQVYCSRQCAGKERTQRFREKKKGKQSYPHRLVLTRSKVRL